MMLPAASFAQSDAEWSDWKVLHSDTDLTVEISMLFDSTTCTSNFNSKYKYRVTGKAKPVKKYVTFKFDYYTCNYRVSCEQLSFQVGPAADVQIGSEIKSQDFIFVGKKLDRPDYPYYEIRLSDTNEKKHIDKGLVSNSPPSSISGKTNIFYGDSTTLSIVDGSISSAGEWKWYADSCGFIPVGKGSSIVVRPQMNTTYFVRAEDPVSKSTCASVTVELVLRSKDPDRVSGITKVCRGESSQLNVEGGHLGKGANWIWYSDSICTAKLGEGSSLNLEPTKSMTVYVRAESPLNITKTVAVNLQVNQKSIPPASIIGPDAVCTGERFTLRVAGGQLGGEAEWVWYNESDKKIGTGESISLTSSDGSAFKVGAESQCFETVFVSKTLVVNMQSQVLSISKTTNENGLTTLFVEGTLGTAAKWVWYEEKKSGPELKYDKQIGTGPSILVSDVKDMHYKVAAEGGICDAQPVAAYTDNGSEPAYIKGWDTRYCLANYKKFTHVGLAVGVMSFTDSLSVQLSDQNSGTNSRTEASIQARGFNWGIMYHPYMYERPKSLGFKPFSFSIGFYYSGEYGFLPSQFTTLAIDTLGGYQDTYERKRFKSGFGSELAIGIRRLRFYFDVQQTQNRYYLGVNYLKTGESTNVVYHYEGNSRTYKIGLRLGRYIGKTSEKTARGVNADLYYLINQIGNSKYSGNTEIALPNQGIGLSIWFQSILKFNCYTSWDNYSRRNFGVSLAYNLDLFY